MKEVKKPSNKLNYKLIDDFLDEMKLKDYSDNTIKNYSIDLINFVEFMNTVKIYNFNRVSKATARNYNTFLNVNKNYTATSRNRKLSSVRMFFDFLIGVEQVEINYFHNITGAKKGKRLPKFIYDDTITTLLNSIDKDTLKGKRDYVLIELLYGTGIRVAELCAIETKDIDFFASTIKIHGKGNKVRIVPMHKTLNIELNQFMLVRSEFLAKSESDYSTLFLNMKGNPLSQRGVRVILDSVVENASMNTHITPHMFRHSFATSMLKQGADIRSVQELLGHENLSSTQIYADVEIKTLQENYNKVFEKEEDLK